MKQKKMMLMGFVSAAAAVTFTYSTSLFADTSAPAEAPSVEASRLQALAKFTKVLGIVEKYYVDEESLETLMNLASRLPEPKRFQGPPGPDEG